VISALLLNQQLCCRHFLMPVSYGRQMHVRREERTIGHIESSDEILEVALSQNIHIFRLS